MKSNNAAKRPSIGRHAIVARRHIALLAAALLAASCGRTAPTRHIILISVDTLRPDHLGCYGYDRETSPRLDRLAREGAFFRAAVSTSSWTLPAHMSMLTGLLPVVHGVQKRHKALDPARPLVQEMLRDAGFRTAGFVSGAFVDERYGFARGFETYTNFWESEEDLFDGVPKDADLEGFLAQLQDQADRAANRNITGPDVVRAASAWLAEHANEPFFLFVHLWEPHYDYIPPPPFDTRFVPEGFAGALSMEGYFENGAVRAGMDTADLAYVISQYDGEIAFADSLVGEILDALGRLGIADETLVLVTSDHGEEFFEHGRKGHRTTLYDESILVPFIVKGPGVRPAPERIDRQVSLIDIAPTLLGAAGLAAHPEMMGEDLRSVLSGRDRTTPRTADASEGSEPLRPAPYAVSQLVGGHETGDPCPRFSVRAPDRKSIADECSGRAELFDLVRDPGEKEDIAGDAPEEAARFLASCRTLREAVAEMARVLPKEGTQPVTIDPELEARLRSLGYLE